MIMIELFLYNISVVTDKSNEDETVKLLKEFEQNHEISTVVYDYYPFTQTKVLYMDFISSKELLQDVCELSKKLPKQPIVLEVVSIDPENGGFHYKIELGEIVSDEYIDPDSIREMWSLYDEKYKDTRGEQSTF